MLASLCEAPKNNIQKVTSQNRRRWHALLGHTMPVLKSQPPVFYLPCHWVYYRVVMWPDSPLKIKREEIGTFVRRRQIGSPSATACLMTLSVTIMTPSAASTHSSTPSANRMAALTSSLKFMCPAQCMHAETRALLPELGLRHPDDLVHDHHDSLGSVHTQQHSVRQPHGSAHLVIEVYVPCTVHAY